MTDQMRTPGSSVEAVPVRGGAATPASSLTPREREVLRRLALGETHELIGSVLGTSARTVRRHRAHAIAKFGGGCIADTWRALGWLQVPA